MSFVLCLLLSTIVVCSLRFVIRCLFFLGWLLVVGCWLLFMFSVCVWCVACCLLVCVSCLLLVAC